MIREKFMPRSWYVQGYVMLVLFTAFVAAVTYISATKMHWWPHWTFTGVVDAIILSENVVVLRTLRREGWWV